MSLYLGVIPIPGPAAVPVIALNCTAHRAHQAGWLTDMEQLLAVFTVKSHGYSTSLFRGRLSDTLLLISKRCDA